MAKKKVKAVKRKTTKKKTVKKTPKLKEVKIDLSTLKFCPECASSNFFYSKMRDELICRDCGGIFSKLTPEQMEKYKGYLK